MKCLKYIPNLIDLAKKSDSNNMHSAVIFNGKNAYFSTNSMRSYIDGKVVPSCHAETSVIRRYFQITGEELPRFFMRLV